MQRKTERERHGRRRLPYAKPRIQTVELAAVEVLAEGCKTTTTGTNSGTTIACVGGTCAGVGSS